MESEATKQLEQKIGQLYVALNNEIHASNAQRAEIKRLRETSSARTTDEEGELKKLREEGKVLRDETKRQGDELKCVYGRLRDEGNALREDANKAREDARRLREECDKLHEDLKRLREERMREQSKKVREESIGDKERKVLEGLIHELIQTILKLHRAKRSYDQHDVQADGYDRCDGVEDVVVAGVPFRELSNPDLWTKCSNCSQQFFIEDWMTHFAICMQRK